MFNSKMWLIIYIGKLVMIHTLWFESLNVIEVTKDLEVTYYIMVPN